MVKNNLRILVTSIPEKGHINAVTGLAEILFQHGHSIIFVQREKYRSLAERRGFQFIPFDEKILGDEDSHEWLRKLCHVFHLNPLERFEKFGDLEREISSGLADIFAGIDQALEKILNSKTPGKLDLIIADLLVPHPSIIRSGILHIPLISVNPRPLFWDRIPPFAGFPWNENDQDKMENFKRHYRHAFGIFEKKLNDRLRANDLPDNYDSLALVHSPSHMGVYIYPEELDYQSELGPPVLEKWFRMDSCIRQSDGDNCGELIIPEKLQNLPGKLIFFSMGSLASNDTNLMNKLLLILSKSPHRFIVSTGPRYFELTLHGNMWGESYVDQIKVLQKVELVITHGGNNTFIESIYFGKPMIIIPYFFDQIDNAQRAVDKGIGLRVNVWDLDEDRLLKAIEQMICDQQALERVKKISERMKNSNNAENIVQMIEQTVSMNN
ncbi:putative UDP-glucosyltransferase YdhE [Brevipalpus obovatus]|uniref:putative UDP-glucosyltransferase YdhE n=1 Tax=Brevipalpus obovatus TaxID=246614 RepID=UPI003D9F48ED